MGSGCRIGQLLGSPEDLPGLAPGASLRLGFESAPPDARSEEVLAPPVRVAVTDQHGAVADDFTGPVTVALAANAEGAELSGTTTRQAVGGFATFDDLTIARAGQAFRLTATAPGVAETESPPFAIAPGPPARLVSVSGNGQVDTVRSTLDADYVVRVTDAAGNPVAGVAVTWTVSAGGGTVAPASSTTDAGGLAHTRHTFGTLAGSPVVTARAAGVSASAQFTATADPGTPARVFFAVQPSHTRVDEVIAPAVEVGIQDQFGNPATTSSEPVEIEITPGSGDRNAQLSGTRLVVPEQAVARFADLRIDRTGLWFRLRARGVNGLLIDSVPFHVVSSR